MVIVKMPERIKPRFSRYIGIDYSGAETPDSSLKGLRVYEASRESVPVEVEPQPSSRKYWTRRGLAEWLVLPAHDAIYPNAKQRVRCPMGRFPLLP